MESPGNEMCDEMKEEIVRYATMVKEVNILKTKKFWLGNVPEGYEDFDGN